MTLETYRTPGTIDPTARIGMLLHAYRSLPWWKSNQARFTAIGTLGVAGWFTVSLTARHGLVGLAAPLLILLGVSAVLMHSARAAKGHALAAHEHGIVVETPTARTVVHFDDVREVSAYISRENGEYSLTHLTLRDATGVHVLPLGLLNAESLVNAIRDRTMGPEYEDALARVAAGGSLQFGNVVLDPFGINTPHWSIRWDKLTNLVVDQGTVQIFRDGNTKPSALVYWEHIPNPLLFSRLVVELRDRARAQFSLASG